MTLVFFDLETTGLDPRKHDVMQIAAAAVDDNLRVIEEFEVKVRLRAKRVSREVLHLTRYDPERWRKEAISARFAALRFARFLRKHATVTVKGRNGPYCVAQLVAHNAAFDGPFLEAWSKRARVRMPVAFRVLCTLQRAEWHFAECVGPRPESMKLLSLAKHFEIPFTEQEAHEALADVRATVELYAQLLASGRRAA